MDETDQIETDQTETSAWDEIDPLMIEEPFYDTWDMLCELFIQGMSGVCFGVTVAVISIALTGCQTVEERAQAKANPATAYDYAPKDCFWSQGVMYC